MVNSCCLDRYVSSEGPFAEESIGEYSEVSE